MTPRDAALEFLRPHVERGAGFDHLRRRLTGRRWDGHRVQVGGYVWPGEEAERLSRTEVAVTACGGKSCLHVFDLRALYRELHERQQPSLFDAEGRPVSFR